MESVERIENVRSREDLLRAYRKFQVLGMAITNPDCIDLSEDERCGFIDLISEIDALLKPQIG